MSFSDYSRLDDSDMEKFAAAVGMMLEVQLAASGCTALPASVVRRALGYIYGFIDAALRTIGQDMADVTIGVPVTFQVLRRLFPGKESDYLKILQETISSDEAGISEMMSGGQQYLDFNSGKLSAPFGLARIIVSAHDGLVS